MIRTGHQGTGVTVLHDTILQELFDAELQLLAIPAMTHETLQDGPLRSLEMELQASINSFLNS